MVVSISDVSGVWILILEKKDDSNDLILTGCCALLMASELSVYTSEVVRITIWYRHYAC